MTIQPAAIVTLRKGLSEQERDAAISEIRKINGVFNVSALEPRKPDDNSAALVNFDGNLFTKVRIWTVKGVVFVNQPV